MYSLFMVLKHKAAGCLHKNPLCFSFSSGLTELSRLEHVGGDKVQAGEGGVTCNLKLKTKTSVNDGFKTINQLKNNSQSECKTCSQVYRGKLRLHSCRLFSQCKILFWGTVCLQTEYTKWPQTFVSTVRLDYAFPVVTSTTVFVFIAFFVILCYKTVADADCLRWSHVCLLCLLLHIVHNQSSFFSFGEDHLSNGHLFSGHVFSGFSDITKLLTETLQVQLVQYV